MTTRYEPFAEHHPAGFVISGYDGVGNPWGTRHKEASTTVGMRGAPEGSWVKYHELLKAEAKIKELERKLKKASIMVNEYRKAFKEQSEC